MDVWFKTAFLEVVGWQFRQPQLLLSLPTQLLGSTGFRLFSYLRSGNQAIFVAKSTTYAHLAKQLDNDPSRRLTREAKSVAFGAFLQYVNRSIRVDRYTKMMDVAAYSFCSAEAQMGREACAFRF